MRKFLCGAAGFFLLLGTMLTCVDIVCFNTSFYEREYDKGNQAEKIGMSDEGLMESTVTLLDYLKDRRDDIVVETEVNGEMREVFNERETLHMIDVKKLYQNALLARNVFVLGAVAVYVILYLKEKKGFFELLFSSWKYALVFMALFVSFIAIWCLADFNRFWTDFHLLFFDNDLWLLDPNTCIMINMFPERFFFDVVTTIIILYAACIVLFSLLFRYLAKRELKNA